METPRPEQGRRIHLLSNFETSRSVGERHSSCKQLLWKPRDPGWQGAPIYLPLKTRDRWGKTTLHVRGYCGNQATVQKRHIHLVNHIWNLASRGAKAQFTYAVTVETRDPGRQGTRISVVTAESSRCGQARHTHLRNYRGNSKTVYACVLYFRSGASSYREYPNNVCVYVCLYIIL
jgi:hypothetical protein